MFEDLERNKPVFCMEFNHNCNFQDSHEGNFGGKKCIKWHIYRRCRRFGELRNHAEEDPTCPHRTGLKGEVESSVNNAKGNNSNSNNKSDHVSEVDDLEEIFNADFNIREFLDTSNMSEDEIDRCEFWVTANQITRQSGKHNYLGEKIQVNYDWNFRYLENELKDYKDKEVINFFKYSWPLNEQNMQILSEQPVNQKGAQSNPQQLKSYLTKERNSGSIIGPFTKNPFGRRAGFSPLDTRKKKDSEDLRVILNLSYPFEVGSVNHSISKETFLGQPMEVKYPSVDDLAKLIKQKSRGKKVKILKRDLKKTYRQMWMQPNSIHLFGYVVDGLMYFDVTLSMGSRSAA